MSYQFDTEANEGIFAVYSEDYTLVGDQVISVQAYLVQYD